MIEVAIGGHLLGKFLEMQSQKPANILGQTRRVLVFERGRFILACVLLKRFRRPYESLGDCKGLNIKAQDKTTLHSKTKPKFLQALQLLDMFSIQER